MLPSLLTAEDRAELAAVPTTRVPAVKPTAKQPAKAGVQPSGGGNLDAWRREVAELDRQIQRIKTWQKQPGAVYGTAQRMLTERITRRSLLQQRIQETETGRRTPATSPHSVERRAKRAQRAMAKAQADRRERDAFNATVPIDLVLLDQERDGTLSQQVASGLAGVVGADPYQDESRSILRKRQQKGKAPTLRVEAGEVGQIKALKPYVDDFLNAARRDYHKLQQQGIPPLSEDRLRAYLQREYAGGRKLTPAQERALPGILAGLQVRWDERVRGAKRTAARTAEIGIGVATGGAGLLPRTVAAAGAGGALQAVVDANDPELTPVERWKSAGTAGLLSGGAEVLSTAWQLARGARNSSVSPGPVSPAPVSGTMAKSGGAKSAGVKSGGVASGKPAAADAAMVSNGAASRTRPGTRVTVKTPGGKRVTGEVTRSSRDGQTVHVRTTATGKEVRVTLPRKDVPSRPQETASATHGKPQVVDGPPPVTVPPKPHPAPEPLSKPTAVASAETPAVTPRTETPGLPRTSVTPTDAGKTPDVKRVKHAPNSEDNTARTTWNQSEGTTGVRKPPTEPKPAETTVVKRGDGSTQAPDAPEVKRGPEVGAGSSRAAGTRPRRPVGMEGDTSLSGTAVTAATRAAARRTVQIVRGARTGALSAAPPHGVSPAGVPPRGAPPGAGNPGQPDPKPTTAPEQKPGAVGVSGPGGSKIPTSRSQGAAPGTAKEATLPAASDLPEVEQDVRDVVERLRSGGRKRNGNGSFTRTEDLQRLKDLRQDWQDRKRGWGGTFRVGEPVVGTRHNGSTEPLVYDGMASATHAYVKDPRTGQRRPTTVPVGSLQRTPSTGAAQAAGATPSGPSVQHLGNAHPMKDRELAVRREDTTYFPVSDATTPQDVGQSSSNRPSQRSKNTTTGPAASSTSAGSIPPHPRGGSGGDPPRGGNKTTNSGGDDYGTPSNPDWNAKVIEWRKEEFEEYARARGYTRDEYILEANRHLNGLLDHLNLYLQVGGDELLAALTEGRFKNQFATGTSRGILSADVRRQTERALWGIPDQAGWEIRPIYGFLHSHPDAVHPDVPRVLDQYGSFTVRLSDDIRPRSTFTGGDSLDRTRWGDFPNLAPASVLRPSILAVSEYMGDVLGMRTPDAFVRSAENSVAYVEAQYFGPVTVKDITEVIFDAGALTPTIKRLLDTHAIPYRTRQ